MRHEVRGSAGVIRKRKQEERKQRERMSGKEKKKNERQDTE